MAIIRFSAPHSLFGVVEPTSYREPKQVESFFPNIDAQLFIECEGQARRPVIEHRGIDPKCLFVDHPARIQIRHREFAPAESLARAKLTGECNAVTGDLGRGQNEIE